MKIIIGLGNPGEQYKLTRHNLGFMVVDALAKQLELTWTVNKKLKAEITKTTDFILIKPQTFMNLSGESVEATLSYYKLSADDLIIIHDDLDLEFGTYKVATASRAAGHNGVQSIMDKLNTQKICRYRVGIKNELREKIPAEKFVLEKFSKTELENLEDIIQKIVKELQ